MTVNNVIRAASKLTHTYDHIEKIQHWAEWTHGFDYFNNVAATPIAENVLAAFIQEPLRVIKSFASMEFDPSVLQLAIDLE